MNAADEAEYAAWCEDHNDAALSVERRTEASYAAFHFAETVRPKLREFAEAFAAFAKAYNTIDFDFCGHAQKADGAAWIAAIVEERFCEQLDRDAARAIGGLL